MRIFLCCGVLSGISSSKVWANKSQDRTADETFDKIIGVDFGEICVPRASGEPFLQELSEEIENLVKIYHKLCTLCMSPDLANYYLGKKIVEIMVWEQKLESEPYLKAESEDEYLLQLKGDVSKSFRQCLSCLKKIFVEKIFENVSSEIYEMLGVGNELTEIQKTALALFLTYFQGNPISSQELASSRALLTCFTLLFEDKNAFSEEIVSKLATWIDLEDSSKR